MEDMRNRLHSEMQAHLAEHEQFRKEREKWIPEASKLNENLRDSRFHAGELDELRARLTHSHNEELERLEVNCEAEIGRLQTSNATKVAMMETEIRKLEAANAAKAAKMEAEI